MSDSLIQHDRIGTQVHQRSVRARRELEQRELNRQEFSARRGGFATLLVLLVIAALSLAVYSFANQAFLEHSATRALMRQTQSRLAAISGIDLLRSKMKSSTRQQRNALLSGMENANAIPCDPQQVEIGFGWYRQASRTSLKPGLNSESAKLNIHSLDLTRAGEVTSRARLMALPNVTPQMADALLDWLDVDDEPRDFGAESAWYAENAPGARPSNGPLRALNQLSRVRGFDDRVLCGEDVNDNGWLDWNEDDSDLQQPSDNRDGVLDLGLAQYLSIDAFESNLDANGNRKIYLNNQDLSELFTQLENRFGERVASFVAAYRLDGPLTKDTAVSEKELRQELDRSFDSRLEQQLDSSGEQVEDRRPKRQVIQRKGSVALDRTPLYRINSVVDLIGVSVITLIDGEEKMLNSPWEFSGADSHDLLLKLEEAMTTVEEDRLLGRIDINQASVEVLMTIPGLSRAKAEAIWATRQRSRAQSNATNDSFRSPYWLIENQILDVEELRRIGSYVTTNGAIYSGYAVGHDWASRSSAIVKFILCHEGSSVRLLEQCEIGFAPLIEQDVRHDRSGIR